jgi:hypothetical protein
MALLETTIAAPKGNDERVEFSSAIHKRCKAAFIAGPDADGSGCDGARLRDLRTGAFVKRNAGVVCDGEGLPLHG